MSATLHHADADPALSEADSEAEAAFRMLEAQNESLIGWVRWLLVLTPRASINMVGCV